MILLSCMIMFNPFLTLEIENSSSYTADTKVTKFKRDNLTQVKYIFTILTWYSSIFH